VTHDGGLANLLLGAVHPSLFARAYAVNRDENRAHHFLTSTVAEFTNPLFQNHLVVSLDPRKNYSHISASRGIGHLAQRRERAPFAADPDSQFDSSGKGLFGGHATPIQAKVSDPLLNPKVRV